MAVNWKVIVTYYNFISPISKLIAIDLVSVSVSVCQKKSHLNLARILNSNSKRKTRRKKKAFPTFLDLLLLALLF